MLEPLKNKLANGAKKAAEVSKTFLEDKNFKVTSEVRESRLEICKSCPHYFPQLEMCKMCGCYMPAKSWIAGIRCPLAKWIEVKNQ